MPELPTGRLDALIQECIERGDFPGAVVLVGHGDEVLYEAAFGYRMIVPERRPMQLDTVFDLASVTKPLATATAILALAQEGRLCLQHPVRRYLPQFAGGGKDEVTIKQLLTHSSGLPAYHNYLDEGLTEPEIINAICALDLECPPDTRLIYSCLGYILLREIVARAAGVGLATYSRERLFKPLGMSDTMFCPPPELQERCAATEQLADRVLCGEVHDENARALGGVGGNAGLFGTAPDLARFCRMVLNLGTLDSVRVLAPAVVRLATSPQSSHPGDWRGLGWDIDTQYSPVLRGDFFPVGSFGHSGFTGTSVWVDPFSASYVIILTNRCHPTREGVAEHVRRGVANVAGAALARPTCLSVPRRPWTGLGVIPRATLSLRRTDIPVRPRGRYTGQVLTGLDVLAERQCDGLRGQGVGLVVNHTAITRARRHALGICRQNGINVRALFCPEHGLRGEYDELMPVPSSLDGETGLPVHSLYSTVQRPFDAAQGRLRDSEGHPELAEGRPTTEMLEGLDTLVFDIADIGVRFYTYTTTMVYCMEEAARHGLRIVVLDRPNPINGVDVEGPVLDPPFRSLSAYHPVPLRHGLTAGELALFANAEYEINCDLEVVPCRGWSRQQWFDETGLPWVNPSPNIRNLTEATLYPLIGPLEAADISVGRGTDTPFELFGASYINGETLAERLNCLALPALRFVPIRFVPRSHKFANERCGGCYVFTTDRRELQPVAAAVWIARALTEMYGEHFNVLECEHLFGSRTVVEAIAQLEDPEDILRSWSADVDAYRERASQYYLYAG